MKIATFKVDPQNGFTEKAPDELPVTGALDIIDELNKMDALADVMVVSLDEHPVDAAWEPTELEPMGTPITSMPNVDMRWNRHCVKGTFGAQLIAGLPSKEAHDFVVEKGTSPDCHPYGALWHDLAKTRSTGAIEFLKNNSVEYVLVGGLALDYCVRETVSELLCAGFKPILNLAATKPVFKESTNKVTEELKGLGALMVNSSVEIPNLLRELRAGNS